MILYLIIILFSTFYFWLIYRNYQKKWSVLKKYPGPKGLPFLGNIFDIKGNAIDFMEQLRQLSTIYGDTFKFNLPTFGWWIITTNPRYIEEILTSPIHINKANFYHIVEAWLINVIGTVKGEQWKVQRKKLNPIFNSNLMDDFCKEIDNVNRDFAENLKNQRNEPFDILPLIKENISKLIFRTMIGDVKPKDMELYCANYQLNNQILLNRFFSLNAFDFIFKYSKEYKKMQTTIKSTYEIIGKLIDDRKMFGNFKNNISQKTFLDVILDYNLKNPENTIENITAQLDNLLFAGHDTTPLTLSAAIYELCCNKEIQEKLFRESNEIFGKDLSAELTMKKLESADYLEMFLKETLRKYPAYTAIGRDVQSPLKLGDVNIPPGTQIVILINALHKNPKYYPEPLKFDPERFSAKNTALRPDFAYIPFSRGPRNCIAQRYGALILKSSIISLVRNFVLSKGSPDFEVKFGAGATIAILGGILLKLERRIE